MLLSIQACRSFYLQNLLFVHVTNNKHANKYCGNDNNIGNKSSSHNIVISVETKIRKSPESSMLLPTTFNVLSNAAIILSKFNQ